MSVPARVLEAFGFAGHSIEPVSGGLINATYSVKGGDRLPVAALQRLHPAFSAEVNIDIDAITSYLASQGLATPRLIKTRDGQHCYRDDASVWRALTWLDGRCYARIPDLKIAEAGAQLVGRFHRELHKLEYDFVFTRSGVHDTKAHLQKLRDATAEGGAPLFAEADQLRHTILQQVAELPTMPQLPSRICHGDLKISNLLYDASGGGLCLIDLDTMGKQTIAYELGDALRSWGNRSGEDTSTPSIDSEVVAATARGYALGSEGLLSDVELGSVIIGLETICLELAARFCVDIFEDAYFGWDSSRYGSRREHNMERAKGQLALCLSVASRRHELNEVWVGAF
jgi:Ser/Thr protein kinase RdoA (MazF antagonist)